MPSRSLVRRADLGISINFNIVPWSSCQCRRWKRRKANWNVRSPPILRFRELKSKDKNRRWPSPPDPWTNHNIARNVHHCGTSTWFTQGDVFKKWKGTGRLLWIHGLRVYLIFVSCAPANTFLQLVQEKQCFRAYHHNLSF